MSTRWRHEYKYDITASQEGILLVKAIGLMQRDPHVREDGSYLIRSLYLDDLDRTCLNDNLAGADPRSKFRIRYYNDDTSRIRLEKKIKNRSMCRKESCALSEDECRQFLQGTVPTVTPEMAPKKQELLLEVQQRCLLPRVIVTYERIPFICEAGNVRVTFDRKLTSARETEKFLRGDYSERPVLPLGGSILEVKWDEVLPLHIKETLQMANLRQTAFSKYFVCEKFRAF